MFRSLKVLDVVPVYFLFLLGLHTLSATGCSSLNLVFLSCSCSTFLELLLIFYFSELFKSLLFFIVYGNCVTYTNTSLIVTAPCKDSAIFGTGKGVVLSTNDLQDSCLLELLDQSWGRGRRKEITNTELAILVKTPGINISFRVLVERVIITTKNIYGILGSYCLYFKRLTIFVAGFQKTTDLTALRITPTKDLLILSKSQRVMRSTDNLL